MNFVAIDFETATSKYTSICSMGICVVENGRVAQRKSFLIRPVPLEFNSYNIKIHGITPDMVEDAPTFEELWPVIRPYLEGRTVVAHNTSFDVNALCATLDSLNITYPVFDYICTVKLSQKAYPDLPSHKLNAMADALGISFNHHHAGDDAYVCARILMKIMEDFELKTLEDIENKFEIGIGSLYPGCYVPCTKSKKKKAKKKTPAKKAE